MGFFGTGNKVTVQIVGDKGRLDKELRGAAKDVDGFGKKSSKSLISSANLIKTAFAGVAAKAIFDFVGGAVSAFSDLNESVNAVEVVFGEASDGIKSLGEQAAETVGLSNAEFNSLAVGFSAFVDKIAEASGGEVVGVLETLTGRISDFASVMNLDVAEAAEKFRSGLSGETEPLRKFGIDVSAAAVSTKALALGLGDSSGKLSEQDKILARYQLIMDQTDKTAGDFANTSGDLANATRILTAKFEDAQAEIGEVLIPTIEALLPLLETGIELIVGVAIGLGQLTGSISEVDAAVRRAKLGLDEEATAVDFLVAAIRRLAIATDNPRFFIDFFSLEKSGLLSAIDEFGNLAETFELTAEDANFLRKNAKEVADELRTTEDVVLALANRLDKDLAQAMLNISAKEGVKLLENTQDIRDAVLDGTDAVFGLVDADEDLAEGFKDIQTEAEKAADRIQGLRDKMQALTDPAFALISAARNYKSALDKQNEALDEYGEKSGEAFDAGVDVLENFQDLIFAADEYAQVTNTDVATALLTMGEKAGVPLAVIRDIIDALGEADNFAGEATLTLDYIEKNRAALDRFLEVNVGAGSPGSGVSIPRDVDVGGIAHTGGRVNAPRGQEVLVRALGGETFSNPAHSNGGGGDGAVQILPVFVGSTTQLAAEIDRMLTKRSRTSGLGF